MKLLMIFYQHFVPDWLLASKMIKKHFTSLYADENILYSDKDVGNVVINCNEMSF